MSDGIRVGHHVKVTLLPACRGGDQPHHPHEQGMHGRVTDFTPDYDHPLFVFFEGSRPPGQSLALGRWFSADELDLV